MNKTIYIMKFVFFVLLLTLSDRLLAEGLNEKKRPNVIVIITDDQGYGDMSVHGNPELQTVNIDQLAHDSVRLDNFHVDPTCSPTRAALMTGRYATRVGVWLTFGGRNHLYRDEVTMADIFKYNGYNTAIFGKWHLGDNYPFRPIDRGFDYSFIHQGGVAGEVPDYWGNNYFDDTYFENGKPIKTQGYSTDVWFDKAKAFIDKHDQKPFFLYLAVNTPHGPFNVEKKYRQPYIDAGIPDMRSRFYGMIQTIDNNVGQLRQYLASNKLAENTLIVFMTDNGTTAGYEGPTLGYPNSGYNAGMRGRKTSAYEGGHRAAGFIFWPTGNLKHGEVLPELTSHIDLLPTFVDMFDLTLPQPIQFDGMNLSPLIQHSEKVEQSKLAAINDRTIIVHNQARFGQKLGEGLPIKDKDFAVMTNRWRLVGNQLFDIKNDPSQKSDISAKHSEVVASLKQQYEHWWRDVTANVRYAPTVINPLKQHTTLLNSQAWHGEKVPYDQQHVRSGFQGRGYWDIKVEQAGEYQIELRRWPRESGLRFTDSYQNPTDIEGLDHNFALYALPEKRFIPTQAQLVLNNKLKVKNIHSNDKKATFDIILSEGVHNIEGLFITEKGEKYGAYYVYISPK